MVGPVWIEGIENIGKVKKTQEMNMSVVENRGMETKGKESGEECLEHRNS